jgi:hypothetical protein
MSTTGSSITESTPLCAVCLEPTTDIVPSETCGCRVPAHAKCCSGIHKCMWCNAWLDLLKSDEYPPAHLMRLIGEGGYYLVNSYYYNSNDLTIIMEECNSTSALIVSYDRGTSRRTMTVSSEDTRDQLLLRTNLMEFHATYRVQFIFINSVRDGRYDNTVVKEDPISRDRVETLFGTPVQPKW